MERPSPKELISALSMPLRDVARGLRAAGHVTEPLLQRAAKMLPAEMAEALRNAASKAEEVGARTLSGPALLEDDIIKASQILTGSRSSGRSQLSQVLSTALQHVLTRHPEAHQMPSETLAALAMRGPGDGFLEAVTGAARGAILTRSLYDAHVIGQFPGLPLSEPQTAREVGFHALMAVVLWLLADRADSLEEERALLDLCAALIDGLAAECPGVDASVEELQSFYEHTSHVV